MVNDHFAKHLVRVVPSSTDDLDGVYKELLKVGVKFHAPPALRSKSERKIGWMNEILGHEMGQSRDSI